MGRAEALQAIDAGQRISDIFLSIAELQFSLRALHHITRNRLHAGRPADAGLVHERGGPCCVSSFNRHLLIAPNSMLPEAKSYDLTWIRASRRRLRNQCTAELGPPELEIGTCDEIRH
ncbi:hypothetical protein DBIPINDM_007883 (plasmid) [Mesorhizobium sp. AR02]|uniref:hypothetical protein n=1 Tax=Mesorhizobium sp. AR02 TaxID=2865837 RepID=UPI00215EE848|nr:hypothetical protein [Mesorhizobium sp. AR02]UVK49819.1 hypothetical protein DBIPINDM_007883 [Mesorhizobium sp. AR02]